MVSGRLVDLNSVAAMRMLLDGKEVFTRVGMGIKDGWIGLQLTRYGKFVELEECSNAPRSAARQWKKSKITMDFFFRHNIWYMVGE